MQENIIPSITVALGALVYGLWGYYQSSKGTKFSFKQFFATILPPFIAAFVAAYTGQISFDSTGDFIVAAFAGFGWAKAQNKLGWN